MVSGIRMAPAALLACAAAVACSGEPGGAQPAPTVAPMVLIPAGTYPIGRDDGPVSSRPAHLVTLGAFRIDRTEVTNAAFVEFLNALRLPVRGSFGIAGIGAAHAARETLRLLTTPPAGASYKSYVELDDDEARIVLDDGRFVPVPGRADHPVTEVTWSGARAFCA